VKDMAFNRWTAKRVHYVLLGSAKDWSDVRRIGKKLAGQGDRLRAARECCRSHLNCAFP
jgi:hypothetical protein